MSIQVRQSKYDPYIKLTDFIKCPNVLSYLDDQFYIYKYIVITLKSH